MARAPVDMQPAYFTPHKATTPASALGCYTCTHNHGQQLAGHVVCEWRGIHVIGTPKIGCAFWEGEPGADDERNAWRGRGCPSERGMRASQRAAMLARRRRRIVARFLPDLPEKQSQSPEGGTHHGHHLYGRVCPDNRRHLLSGDCGWKICALSRINAGPARYRPNESLFDLRSAIPKQSSAHRGGC